MSRAASGSGAQTVAAIQDRIVRCRRCPELRRYCAAIAKHKKREFAHDVYWGKPVPNLGTADARLLIVGLAPAAHGGNRTGRMFTGDGSADWLARALFAHGFATQPTSVRRDDGYALIDAFMTAAIRCAPPGNKPTPQQVGKCASHLSAELDVLSRLEVVVPLGKIGFDTIVRQLRARGYQSRSGVLRFAHGAEFALRDVHDHRLTLLCSYHPSRQNTNTGKLSQAMLDQIFARARQLIGRTETALSSSINLSAAR